MLPQAAAAECYEGNASPNGCTHRVRESCGHEGESTGSQGVCPRYWYNRERWEGQFLQRSMDHRTDPGFSWRFLITAAVNYKRERNPDEDGDRSADEKPVKQTGRPRTAMRSAAYQNGTAPGSSPPITTDTPSASSTPGTGHPNSSTKCLTPNIAPASHHPLQNATHTNRASSRNSPTEPSTVTFKECVFRYASCLTGKNSGWISEYSRSPDHRNVIIPARERSNDQPLNGCTYQAPSWRSKKLR